MNITYKHLLQLRCGMGISNLANKIQKNMAPRGEVKVNDASMLFGQLQIICVALQSSIFSRPTHVPNFLHCAWGEKQLNSAQFNQVHHRFERINWTNGYGRKGMGGREAANQFLVEYKTGDRVRFMHFSLRELLSRWEWCFTQHVLN
jgi:hypothetical protein